MQGVLIDPHIVAGQHLGDGGFQCAAFFRVAANAGAVRAFFQQSAKLGARGQAGGFQHHQRIGVLFQHMGHGFEQPIPGIAHAHSTAATHQGKGCGFFFQPLVRFLVQHSDAERIID
ncbi:hypothetical protein Amal_00270 [Acetobacter malorum]|uniref:Uncharacterized protein n=1 Tax=Acetobacter malorum TaxID=178901 RepID=A0A177GEK9_9PROT|nr:hypothetical protein Amal_00270 [Acetobacter malorum]